MPLKKLFNSVCFGFPYVIFIFTVAFWLINTPSIDGSNKNELPLIRSQGTSIDQEAALEKAFQVFLKNIPEKMQLAFLTLEVSIQKRGRSSLTAVFSFKPETNELPEYSLLMEIFSGISHMAEKVFNKNISANSKPLRFNYGIAITKNESMGKESCLLFARESPRGMILIPQCFLRLLDGQFLQIPVGLENDLIKPDKNKATPGETDMFYTFFSKTLPVEKPSET
ncbi:MAG: hypothetical protein P9M03_13165 [Candidatus Theseobacter exili]|nr:hypothetical protein [Candidatus Theseobacter exili]